VRQLSGLRESYHEFLRILLRSNHSVDRYVGFRIYAGELEFEPFHRPGSAIAMRVNHLRRQVAFDLEADQLAFVIETGIPGGHGKWIYYSKANGSIWKVAVDDGEEIHVLDARSTHGYPLYFHVTASGIYFAGAPDPGSGTSPLKLYRFADRRT